MKNFLSGIAASQLAKPSSLSGWLLGMIWNRRNKALNDAVFDLLALQPADSVLEIGFSGGYLLERMASVITTGFLAGVDHSPALLAYVKKRTATDKPGREAIDLKCAPAESLPFTDNQFTAVCSVNSIFYWQKPELGLREIMRVLEKNGRLVLCFTSKPCLEKKRFAGQINLVEHGELAEKLSEIGFQDINTHEFFDPNRQYFCLTASKRP